MRNYTTQMDAARKGILTPEMKTVAEKEHFPEEKLMALVAEGKVVICANKSIPVWTRRDRKYAAHESQCEPGSIPGLQGL